MWEWFSEQYAPASSATNGDFIAFMIGVLLIGISIGIGIVAFLPQNKSR